MSILAGESAGRSGLAILAALLAFPLAATTVSGHVSIVGAHKHGGDSGVVIWLDPRDEPPPIHPAVFRMAQRQKQFQPHVLAIPVGSSVDFPNFDPIFHNAFSNVAGKIFDVGLYPPGTTRRVRFDKPGIVHVFCNIHSSMSAVIVVESTPWIATSDAHGRFTIAGVTPGRYAVHVYYERATKETLDRLERNIEVDGATATLPEMQISETGFIELPHKNKYGQDYPPAEGQPGYGGAQ